MWIELRNSQGPDTTTHLDVDSPLLVTVAIERVRMLLRSLALTLGNLDALPSKLFDSDECLVQMRVFGDEVSTKVDRKALWAENVRGSLRKIWAASRIAYIDQDAVRAKMKRER